MNQRVINLMNREVGERVNDFTQTLCMSWVWKNPQERVFKKQERDPQVKHQVMLF